MSTNKSRPRARRTPQPPDAFALNESVKSVFADARAVAPTDRRSIEDAADEIFDEVCKEVRNIASDNRDDLPRFFAAVRHELSLVPASVRSRLIKVCTAEGALIASLAAETRSAVPPKAVRLKRSRR